jgi:hypothetical protein
MPRFWAVDKLALSELWKFVAAHDVHVRVRCWLYQFKEKFCEVM